jgi:hypothetical protein
VVELINIQGDSGGIKLQGGGLLLVWGVGFWGFEGVYKWKIFGIGWVGVLRGVFQEWL